MRAATWCLLVLAALTVAATRPVQVELGRCAPATAADSNGDPLKPKASAFAPRPRHGHVYGVPIQPPIVKSRTRPKPRKPTSPPP